MTRPLVAFLAPLVLVFTACTPAELIRIRFGAEGERAVGVATCESGLDPAARSTDGSNHGLFQINNVHRSRWPEVTGLGWEARYDPVANIDFAHALWSEQGWRPWTCRP